TRNRMRAEVLPLLEQIAPGAARSLARLGALARREEAGWQALVDDLLEGVVLREDAATVELDRAQLAAYHPGVQARLLRTALGRLGARPGEAATRAALALVEGGRSGSGVDVGGALRVRREFDRIVIRRTDGDEPPAGASRVRIEGPGEGHAELRIGDARWRVEWHLGRAGRKAAEGGAEEGPTGPAARFDPAALSFPLLLRGWLPGDRIRLASGSRKLKKLFGERRVGAGRRGALPVLVDREGGVLWVAGVERASRAAARAGEPALVIRVLNADRG
ncbi:MAG TPA: tRNA lysidine(34) synthetase TilS, partial [Longimicrobiales bacterium]|nr:tRNA lysidine(34) synthetase TilS [Longimicrobiales bacterium]